MISIFSSIFQLHPFMKKMVAGISNDLTFPVNIFPSLAPPLPWTNVMCGGYLFPAGKSSRFVADLVVNLTDVDPTLGQK